MLAETRDVGSKSMRHHCAIARRGSESGHNVGPDQTGWRRWSKGGDDGTRTHDPLLAKMPETDGGEH
jgi:hypothetical protein